MNQIKIIIKHSSTYIIFTLKPAKTANGNIVRLAVALQLNILHLLTDQPVIKSIFFVTVERVSSLFCYLNLTYYWYCSQWI